MHFPYSALLLIGASLLLARASASSSWRANTDDNEDETSDEPSSKGWWDSGKFQGDIAGFEDQNDFNNNFVQRLNNWQNQMSSWRLNSATSDPRGLWPNGRVPYVILSKIYKLHVAVNQAIREIQSSTCVRFVQHTNETNYLKIVDADDGCWSLIGNRRKGAKGQVVSLSGKSCHNKQTALHELMHAIGFWHEHQRTDRDEYIEVLEENIQPKCHKNYVVAPFDRMLLIGQYDVDSVMHYPSKAGACAKPGRELAMKLKNSDREDFGASQSLTNEDIKKIRILYGCDTIKTSTNTLSATTSSRPTTTPVICPTCNCPSANFTRPIGEDASYTNFTNLCHTQYGGVANGMRCFFAVDSYSTWEEAWTTCRRKEGILASILTKSESKSVLPIIMKNYFYWTSARKRNLAAKYNNGPHYIFIYESVNSYNPGLVRNNTWLRTLAHRGRSDINDSCVFSAKTYIDFDDYYVAELNCSDRFRSLCQMSRPGQQFVFVPNICLTEQAIAQITGNLNDCSISCGQFSWCRSFNFINNNTCQFYPWHIADGPDLKTSGDSCLHYTYVP